jgi:hypothetical protein
MLGGGELFDNDLEAKNAWLDTLPFNQSRLIKLLPALIDQCGFAELRVYPEFRLATGKRRQSIAGPTGVRHKESVLDLRWRLGSNAQTTDAAILVYQEPEQGVRTYDIPARDRVVAVLTRLSRAQVTPSETVIAPGQPFEGRMTGTIRDYSGCAEPGSLGDLCSGTLPLGQWTFGTSQADLQTGPELFLSKFQNGEPMEFSSVLICAPTGAGKTELLLRWARAANAVGHCCLIVDVKGNMSEKLGKLRGDLYRISTNPKVVGKSCDRINFLRQLEVLTAPGSQEVRQFAEILLPSEGWRGVGGQDEQIYRNRLLRLVAFLHLLKLRELYFPDFFDKGSRKADLGDLYDLVMDEKAVCDLIKDIQDKERKKIAAGHRSMMPEAGVDHWAGLLAPILSKDLPHNIGQRSDPKYGYLDYVAGIILALEPFARHGVLYRKIRDSGPGRRFSLSEIHRTIEQQPAAIVLETREQEGESAWTILSLALKSIQPLIFNRWNLPREEREKLRPILLLLDETRRIRNFEADDYITVAREAAAGCVLVYQNLDQVVEQFGDTGLNTILENVGTQVYLKSLSGNTAQYFIKSLPERYRTTETVSYADGSVQSRTDAVPYFTKLELYQLPAGRYPALVFIKGRAQSLPFLVNMDSGRS